MAMAGGKGLTIRRTSGSFLLLVSVVGFPATALGLKGADFPYPLIPPLITHLFTYMLPFVSYFMGICIRYYAKFLRSDDAPPLNEQLIAGVAFSLIAVAPLIPSLRLAVVAQDVTAYMLATVVIMQEGMFLHEHAVRAVNKRRARIKTDG